jgi:hypothetical protein
VHHEELKAAQERHLIAGNTERTRVIKRRRHTILRLVGWQQGKGEVEALPCTSPLPFPLCHYEVTNTLPGQCHCTIVASAGRGANSDHSLPLALPDSDSGPPPAAPCLAPGLCRRTGGGDRGVRVRDCRRCDFGPRGRARAGDGRATLAGCLPLPLAVACHWQCAAGWPRPLPDCASDSDGHPRRVTVTSLNLKSAPSR